MCVIFYFGENEAQKMPALGRLERIVKEICFTRALMVKASGTENSMVQELDKEKWLDQAEALDTENPSVQELGTANSTVQA